VIDDWVMAPLSEPKRRDFWEICEDRKAPGSRPGGSAQPGDDGGIVISSAFSGHLPDYNCGGINPSSVRVADQLDRAR